MPENIDAVRELVMNEKKPEPNPTKVVCGKNTSKPVSSAEEDEENSSLVANV